MISRPVTQITLGDRLRRARLNAGGGGITRDQMAANMRVSPRTITRWEHDHVVPSWAEIHLWATITCVDADWLEEGDRIIDLRRPA